MPLAAIAQFTSTNILAHNLKICQKFVRTAASKGAVALFLPEASDYISSSAEESLELCQSAETSPFVLGLREEAKKCALAVNVGIHEPTSDGLKERVRNTSIWIDGSGEITQRYQKVHIFDVDIEGGPKILESRSTEPGSALTPPFDTPIGKLGLLICFDLRFPEVSLALRRQGASILTYPSAFTIPTGQAHWEILLRARAIEAQSWVIAAAQVGKHNEKRRSYGHAMVVDPWGKVVAECSEEKEDICFAEIDSRIIERVRREVPLKRRFDVYPEV
ncbi:carbon-nitrogen hydrolase [Choiromyces venosus 120613-1]|uniref:Carbon-nitrogen hydrolase n=1 Tax=Choiromyces venosus 120613-1 TaxID=1336337 RepID=A0A3N4JR41_9PEZI|nr:carbon-nitrogen hydrolase [Choiromyces venosus 120613-1]